MKSVVAWLHAIRARTLPLSLSGVLVGGAIAYHQGCCDYMIVALCALTALFLQVLCNLSNDIGDFKNGVDSAQRVGPARVMQGEEITERGMWHGIVVSALLAMFSGAFLLYHAYKLDVVIFAVFVILGLGALAAAVFYTLGSRPYGYHGFGDVFCFIFFGLVAVAGTFYLASGSILVTVLLPGAAFGLLSNAVLNLNNMRDMVNDKAYGKNSIVVKFGISWAKSYHGVLVFMPFVLLTIFVLLGHYPLYSWAFWVLFPFFLVDYIGIIRNSDYALYDRYLERQAIRTIIMALVFCLGML